MWKKILKKVYAKRDKRRKQFCYELEELLEHPVILEMKKYPHHGVTNCYQHCVNVAYQNYFWCGLLGLNAKAAARGGMMHDLFLYDWHEHTKKTGDHFHGLTHPRVAYNNARERFDLNKVEKDIILSHMWPVTPFKVPRTWEGLVMIMTDKYCSAWETCHRRKE